MGYTGLDMIACNIAAHQVDTYLDTGYLMPVVVPPVNRRLFGQPVGLWCIGDNAVPSDTRLGYGGKTEWRKLWLWAFALMASALRGQPASHDGAGPHRPRRVSRRPVPGRAVRGVAGQVELTARGQRARR